MSAEPTAIVAFALLGFVLAWPAMLVAWRRRVTREASDVAAALESFALEARRATAGGAPSVELVARVSRLRLPELAAFRLAPSLPHATPALIADAASRLALRLRRRVAFERKMLARTAPGRRRAAIAGAVPPAALLLLMGAGADFPGSALLLLVFTLGVGCWLQARIARVVP